MCRMSKRPKLNRGTEFLNIIINNSFYRYGAHGDVMLMAALTRFVCFCLQFDKASYYHLKVLEFEDKAKSNNGNLSDTDEAFRFFYVQDAILGYNSCYDTLLQAIKFFFKLSPGLSSRDDFEKALKDCKWKSGERIDGIRDLLERSYSFENKQFKSFMKKSGTFFVERREKNACFANKIKHNGGVITTSLKAFFPQIIKDKDVKYEKKATGECKFVVQEDTTSFKMEWLCPLVLDFKSTLQSLDAQNKYIFEYVQYLFDLLQFNQFKNITPLDGEYIFPFEPVSKNIASNDTETK